MSYFYVAEVPISIFFFKTLFSVLVCTTGLMWERKLSTPEQRFFCEQKAAKRKPFWRLQRKKEKKTTLTTMRRQQ